MGKIPFTFGQDCLFFQIERKPGKKDQNFQKKLQKCSEFPRKNCKNAQRPQWCAFVVTILFVYVLKKRK